MDLRAQHLSETCSDPIEYLRQLRQTTEPIGGGTVYSEDGELVEYDVAIEAVGKANDAFIEKAAGRLRHYLDNGLWIASDVVCWEKEAIVEDFKNYLKYGKVQD